MKTTADFLHQLRTLGIEVRAENTKIKISAPKKTFTPELQLEVKRRKQEILEYLALKTPLSHASKSLRLEAIPRDGFLRASAMQEALYALHHFDPESPFLNSYYGIRLIGSLQVDALEHSFQTVIQRHEALRTTFTYHKDQLVQQIAATATSTLPVRDLQDLPEDERESHALKLTKAEARTPFDLSKGPLLKAGLFILGADRHLLYINAHHTITDGWSFDRIAHEMVECYAAFKDKKSPALPEIPIQFADYAYWQHRWIADGALDAQYHYWKSRLAGGPDPVILPTDLDQGIKIPSHKGSLYHFEISRELEQKITTFTRSRNITHFHFFISLLAIVIQRYSQQVDFAICFPIANRDRVNVEYLVGYLNNLVPLRFTFSEDPDFLAILHQCHSQAIEAIDHADLPFSEIANLPELARSQLSRVMFVFEVVEGELWQFPGLRTAIMPIDNETADSDMSFILQTKGGRTAGEVRYRTDLMSEDLIGQFVTFYLQTIEQVLADPTVRISQLPAFAFSQGDRRVTVNQGSDGHHVSRGEQGIRAAPGTSVEIQLCAIWEDLLGVRPIGIHDNFFDLGGHSLLAVRLFTKIETAFGKRIPLSLLVQSPTVAEFAPLIARPDWKTTSSALVEITGSGMKPPFYFVHGVGGHVLRFYTLAQAMGTDQPFYGLQSYGLDGTTEPLESIEEIAARYIQEISKVQTAGPYFIGGLSFGSYIAFEMGRQLIKNGQTVGFIAVFDTRVDQVRKYHSNLSLYEVMCMKLQFSYDQLVMRGARWNAFRRLLFRLPFKKKIEYVKWLSKRERRRRASIRMQESLFDTETQTAPRQLQKVLRANERATENYAPEKAPLDVLLFKATHSRISNYGWNFFAMNGVREYSIPGTHTSIIEEPSVQLVVAELKDHMKHVLEREQLAKGLAE